MSVAMYSNRSARAIAVIAFARFAADRSKKPVDLASTVRRVFITDDEKEIPSVVATYVTGFNQGDQALLLNAYHPRFISSGFVDRQLQWDTAGEFAAFCAAAAPDPDGPVPGWEIETLFVSGQTAVAIVLNRWGARPFRDSLTLLKDHGRWQIAFKAFHGLE